MTEQEMMALSRPELYEKILDNLERVTEVFAELPDWYVKHRPIVGGVFGVAGFSLCSYGHTKNGLDAVLYFVRETESKFSLSAGSLDKASAIQSARETLQLGQFFPLGKRIASYKARKAAEQAEARRVRNLEDEERQRSMKGRKSAVVRSIPRRRQRIFEESGGKCHYCQTVLTLDGRWHVEHKMPKALGGDSAPGNLVASCAPCNHAKRDTTDQEFIAKRAKKSAA